jgi:hypothetical protein
MSFLVDDRFWRIGGCLVSARTGLLVGGMLGPRRRAASITLNDFLGHATSDGGDNIACLKDKDKIVVEQDYPGC